MEGTQVTNQVELIGKVSNIQFHHKAYDEKFYSFTLETKRTSGTSDFIPVVISEKLLPKDKTEVTSEKVHITGRFASYNKHLENGRNKLLLYVFTDDIKIVSIDEEDVNSIIIEGFICKKPSYRKTPAGREITDFIFAVNRNHKKSDYIPCICWGRNAKFVANLRIGDRLCQKGRIQSRVYFKALNPNKPEEKTSFTAYEVSISKTEPAWE